jgi:cyclic pyranopterin monophosphate synthase
MQPGKDKLRAQTRASRSAKQPSRPDGLTHLSAAGDARMVNVAPKPPTARRAVASAIVRMRPTTAERIVQGTTPKGDVLAAARIAGIMAAKHCSALIPLCHPLAITHAAIELAVEPAAGEARILATVEAFDRTGVEMEALVAASVAALTIYDMLKAIDRDMSIEQVALLEKRGGRSGHYRRDASRTPATR